MKHKDKNYVKVRECRSCSREYLISNPRQLNCMPCINKYGKDRLRWLWKKYNITIKQYIQLLKNADFKCQICRVILDDGNTNNTACIDHCHETNKIRGILCRKCNRAMGQLVDTEESIKRVLDYLRS